MSQSSVTPKKKPCSGRAFYNSRSFVACCSCSKSPQNAILMTYVQLQISKTG